MDAVEVNYPVDVGSESFGGDRVSLKDSVLVSQRGSIEPCSSLIDHKDRISSLKALEFTSHGSSKDSELCQNATKILGSHAQDVSKPAQCSSEVSPAWITTDREVKVHKRAVRVSRSGNVCPKRPRITLLEDSVGPSEVDDTKDILDKTQSVKQRNNLSSKRGDRRNFKVATRNRYDSFSLKGFTNFSSSGGANNFYGAYGLKTDIHDITKLVEDLSLKDLLDGNYQCPSFDKDKEKKDGFMTANIMISVRKACSVIQPPSRPQSEQLADVDSWSDEKMPLCSSGSLSVVGNVDNGDPCATELSSPGKNSSKKPEGHVSLLDNPFNEPKDTLQHLALPPQKDLESLLQDASKPSVSSKATLDPRSGKQVIRRASLPLFSWSQYNGHPRTNSDAAKLLTNRSTCQGRWVRTGNSVHSLGMASDHFVNIESLAYDESLVPSLGPRLSNLEDNIESSRSVPCCEGGSSLGGATSLPPTVVVPLGSMNDRNSQVKVEHCSRLFAAAQTLCDIATNTSKLKQAGTLKWPKKTQQKVMKARKLKSNEKPDELFSSSSSLMGFHHEARGSTNDYILPAKRLKVTSDNNRGLVAINGVRRSTITCSKSRLSPKKSVARLIAETKQSTPYTVKQSYSMSQPAKVINGSCSGQQKVRSRQG